MVAIQRYVSAAALACRCDRVAKSSAFLPRSIEFAFSKVRPLYPRRSGNLHFQLELLHLLDPIALMRRCAEGQNGSLGIDKILYNCSCVIMNPSGGDSVRNRCRRHGT